MRNLDYNEFKLCQLQAKLFESSYDLSHFSSSMFIRRFMTSDYAKSFYDKSFLVVSYDLNNIIYDLNNSYQASKNKTLYTKNELYWIGYIYLALCFLYEINPKKVYKLFNGLEIVKYYNIYHTFDIEEAANRMMDNINYINEDYTTRGVKILRRLILEEEKENLLKNDD